MSKTDILKITGTDSDPQLAADVANAFAEEYIKWRSNIDRAVLMQARIPIEQQIRDFPLDQRESASYKILVDKLETLRLFESMQMGSLQVVKPAVPEVKAVSPKPLRTGMVGFLTSIFLGIGAVFVMEHFDTKMRSAAQIKARINKPILASIPTQPDTNGRLVCTAHPNGPCAEAFRLLKTNLSYLSPDKKTRTIMITSPGPYEGKSTTVANLAVTMARGGQGVVVLEADFRKPSLYKYFKLSNDYGLTNLIAGTHSLSEAMQAIEPQKMGVINVDEGDMDLMQKSYIGGLRPVYCITSGPIPPNPGELVASDKFAGIIDSVANFSDVVLIDTPPLGVVGDAASLASKVDGVILVVRMSRTDSKELDMVQDFMNNVPCNLLGIVITDADTGDSYGTGGYYQYGYSQ